MSRNWSRLTAQPLSVFLVLTAAATTTAAAADESQSDSHARSAIFAEQHVQGTAFDWHRHAAALPVEQRFEWLANRLLPSDEHSALRVGVAFAPTNPGPIDAFPTSDPARHATKTSRQPRREPVGGGLVSPLLDLIDAARETDRLDELRTRVSSIDSAGMDPSRRRDAEIDRTSTLALIELAAGNIDEAFTLTEQSHQLAFQSDQTAASKTAEGSVAAGSDLFEPPDALLLLLTRMIDVPELREPAGTMLARVDRWMRDLSVFDARQRHLMALANRIRLIDESRLAGVESVDAGQSSQWQVVSRMTAESRGLGSPNPLWMFRPGHAELNIPHERDYLYFNVPLRGNFDLECDVAMGGWDFVSPVVAGRWLGAAYTQDAFDSGTFRYQSPRQKFAPKLSQTKRWLHYRTTVRDGVVTTHFNGRPIDTRSIGTQADPWLAIRSNPRDRGTVRDVRISGTPMIPDQIELLSDVGLGQWHAYFGEEVGDVGDHWVMIDGVLHAQRDAQRLLLDGVAWTASDDSSVSVGWDERLLRYHRPMLEDGVISYEFYYQPEAVHVHPTLDRLTFLLSPSGVRLHQVTDGPYDRTGLSPTNTFEEPAHRLGPDRLPLKPDDWNRVELRVSGDEVSVVLNGVETFRRPIDAENRRTFGLFHFADQTAVQVRNIIWRGDWPRELPPVAEQELANHAAEFLDQDSDRLAATFEHEFNSDGLSPDLFTLVRGNASADLSASGDGLRVTRKGTGPYQQVMIAPALRITGDFDAIAQFDQFAAETAIKGNATVALMAFLENATNDEYWLGRRHAPQSADKVDDILQCVSVRTLPVGEQREYFVTEPMEARSGRFRLSRRGDQLYYLTSEADSPNWRLRGVKEISTDPIATDGLRMLTQIHQVGGAVSVHWRRLSIRAEGLSGRAMGGTDTELAELNMRSDQLLAVRRHDFREMAPPPDRFYQWGLPTAWKADPRGWLLTSTGTDEWSSCGIAAYTQLTGDFDITVRISPKQLAVPKAGKYTQMQLQVEGSDEDRIQVASILNRMPDGELIATAQIREKRASGGYSYRPLGKVGLPSISRLRLARSGSTLTILAGAADDAPDQIVARYRFNDLPIQPGGIRFLLHTGGEGLESQVHLQSLEVRAHGIVDANPPLAVQSLDGQPAPRNPGPQQPGTAPKKPAASDSLLDRVIQFFK